MELYGVYNGGLIISTKDENDSEPDEDTKEYEVDKIMDIHTKCKGKTEFLIRWKGFGKNDDTWEEEKILIVQIWLLNLCKK